MVKVKVGNKDIELADTLRVVYEIKNQTGAKNMRDAMASMSKMDFDEQMKLLYTSYKCKNRGTPDFMSEQQFTEFLLDNLGLYAITDIVEQLVDGIMYSGLSPEEVAKKKQAEKEAEALDGTDPT